MEGAVEAGGALVGCGVVGGAVGKVGDGAVCCGVHYNLLTPQTLSRLRLIIAHTKINLHFTLPCYQHKLHLTLHTLLIGIDPHTIGGYDGTCVETCYCV